jgi:hypothetical protein
MVNEDLTQKTTSIVEEEEEKSASSSQVLQKPSTPFKRQRESPQDPNTTAKNQRTHNMGDTDSKLDEILNKLKKLDLIEQSNIALERKFDEFRVDMDLLKSQQQQTTQKIKSVESDMKTMKEDIRAVDNLKNRFEQQALRNDVTIFGIPSTYHLKKDELIEVLNRALNLSFTINSFKFISTFNIKQSKCTARLSFLAYEDKYSLMKAAESLSKDSDGKRQPLTIEDIFEEFKDVAPHAGQLIFFTNSLTKHTNNLLKLKSQVKPMMLYERDGKIMIKQNKEARAVEVWSKEEILNFSKNNKPR